MNINIKDLNLGLATANSVQIILSGINLGSANGSATLLLCFDGVPIKNHDQSDLGIKVELDQDLHALWDTDEDLITVLLQRTNLERA
jgi:hypothetical protein